MSDKHAINQSQLESLTSPVRLAIIQRLDIDKAATAQELAQRMGRPVTSLYHHLKQLLEVRLLHVVEMRPGTRRPEAVYANVGRLSSAKAVATPRGKRAYGKTGVRIADAGARAFSSAIARGDARLGGEERNTTARHYVLRANKAKLAEINELLDKLGDTAARSDETGEEIQVTILLSPLRPKR
jgi:predicted ArsR family transcriptional regulator